MILFYAPGEGLGHLTRVRAAIHTLKLSERIVLITDSPYASTMFPDAIIFGMEPNFQQLLNQLKPDAVYLDAFPCGIHGELSEIIFSQPVYHFARILRWDFYRSIASGPLPHFQKTYVLEELQQDQLCALKQCSEQIESLALYDPPKFVSHDETLFHKLKQETCWIIVHAGPENECEELTKYAKALADNESVDPEFILLTPKSGVLDSSISNLFPYAGRIISGCGFNIMRQTEPFSAKHHFLPFPRRFDNQFLRASRRRESTTKSLTHERMFSFGGGNGQTGIHRENECDKT
ncbi:MAG: hypothetical protein C5B54_04465 [Acidobacteria bacterium]|nr:MAG: hypothetical protein C5B54_04465 [Acidobacteriota bacterium]